MVIYTGGAAPAVAGGGGPHPEDRPMLALRLSLLNAQSTLADLPTHNFRVSPRAPGHSLAAAFEQQPDLPGVIVGDAEDAPTLISRQGFFAQMSRPFSLEIYLKRPVQVLLNALPGEPLHLPASATIPEAARAALNRPANSVYEPLLILSDDDARVLDIHVLLLAQAHLLELANALINKQKEEALAASRVKSQFLANMSHEIRTPMGGILGMTDLALATRLDAEQREYLGMVKSSAQTLLTILDDILDFSKIEAGKLSLDPIDFSLRDLLGDTLAPLAMRAHARGLELACRVDPQTPDALIGDPVRLRQVVVNLVGNALKFTEHGEVVVQVEEEAGAVGVQRVEEAVETGNVPTTLLRFLVRDTGIGIARDKLGLIFQPFEQADGSTTRKFGGTGLGLAISGRLVEMMGGRLGVDSEPGRGSSFQFTARFGRRSPAAALPAPALRRLPVLVADDNATSRGILTELLTAWGARPAGVDGGSAALAELDQAAARNEPYAAAVFDAGMPAPDGFTLARRALRHPGLTGPVVLLLSSPDRVADVGRCRTLGVAGHLGKPVKPSDLLETLLTALGQPGLRRPDPHMEAAPLPVSRKLRVLLAEDHIINQRLAIALLQKRGHTVTVANNGREAVDAIEREDFDVVLMDVAMPELGGFEATALVREREKGTGRRLPIVAVTAHAMKGDRDQCLEAGMDAYLAKPLQERELCALLATMFPPDEEAEDGPAPFDEKVALRNAGGDPTLCRELAQLFVTESAKLLTQLGEAIALRDSTTVHRVAHTLKGATLTFAAADAQEAAHALEKMGRAGTWDGVEEVWGTLKREIGRLVVALERLEKRE